MPNTLKVVPIPASALVVLVGVAGSGKSTFAHAHFRATEILSSDEFRALVSDDEADQSASEDAFAVLYLVLAKRLRRGRLSVVDATNLLPSYRANLIAIAAEHQRLAVAIVFDFPEQLCLSRAGARTHRVVTPEIIHQQWQALVQQTDEQLLSEGFATVVRLKPDERVELARTLNRSAVCTTGEG